MIPLERARQRLQSLGLKQLAEVLGTTLYAEANRRLTCPEMPAHPEAFNPGFQPSIDERQVWQWSSWPRPATRCCWGRPARARPAWRGPGHPGSGYGAYSVCACDLMEDLRRARAEHNLDPRMRVYPASKLLVADEFGIRRYDRDSTLPRLSSPWARPATPALSLPKGAGQHHPHSQQGLR